MKYLTLSILVLLSLSANAQNNPGPRFTALGLTGIALQDVWSLQSNQAGLAGLEHPVLSGAYEKKYSGSGLSMQSAVFAYPFNRNVVGISFQNYGFSAYTEQRIGFAYAKRFGNVIFAALNINYHQIKIQQYGSASTFSVEAGLQYKPDEKLCIATHISNPNRNAYNNDVNATIPLSIEFGASYHFSDKVLFQSSVVKILDYSTDLRTGLEYDLLNWLSLRGGASVNPLRQYAGLGIKYSRTHLDFAVASHPTLGYSPQVAFGYEF